MARVITFSRLFPSDHPRAGQQTNFVEQIWNGLRSLELPVPKNSDFPNDFMWSILPLSNFGIKVHTIRRGKRWKVGDKFSPRVWSGKPYASFQITISPDLEIKKVWDFEMQPLAWIDECKYFINGHQIIESEIFSELAKRDGLEINDFAHWIAGPEMMSSTRKPFVGQIICWDESVEYTPT